MYLFLGMQFRGWQKEWTLFRQVVYTSGTEASLIRERGLNFHFHANLLAQMACQFPARLVLARRGGTSSTSNTDAAFSGVSVEKNIGNMSPAPRGGLCVLVKFRACFTSVYESSLLLSNTFYIDYQIESRVISHRPGPPILSSGGFRLRI